MQPDTTGYATFEHQLGFGIAVLLLFPAPDAAVVFARVLLLRIFNDQPAIADYVFFDFVVGVFALDQFFVVLTGFASLSVLYHSHLSAKDLFLTNLNRFRSAYI